VATPAFERTPPHNVPAEKAVLGAMLINAEAVASALEVLRHEPAELFYVPAHQHIFSAMTSLFSSQARVDEVTVGEQLVRDGGLETAGGYTYLADLISAAPLSTSIDYYAEIVLDNAILRKMISSCSTIVHEAYAHEGEVQELLDRAESTIFSIAERRQISTISRIGELLEDTIHRVEEVMKSGAGLTGLPTGFNDLDQKLSGLQNAEVIIVAARPSVGKTAFALNVARHAGIKLNKGVLLFSLEMSKSQLMQRFFCMEGRIDYTKLRSGFLSNKEFQTALAATRNLENAPVYIDESPNLTVLDVRARARRHAAQHGLDLVIIDYLQLMSSPRRGENRQVEIAEISRGLKGISRELDVPVMALSQLSREAEKDESGIPKLSHLRESGAIEQDADVVLMLTRAADVEADAFQVPVKLTIAKQRNGPLGRMDLIFKPRIQRFVSGMGQHHAPDAPPPGDGDTEPYEPQPVIDDEYFEPEAEDVGGDEDVPF